MAERRRVQCVYAVQGAVFLVAQTAPLSYVRSVGLFFLFPEHKSRVRPPLGEQFAGHFPRHTNLPQRKLPPRLCRVSTQTKRVGPGIFFGESPVYCHEPKERYCVPGQCVSFTQKVNMCKQDFLHCVCSVEKDLGVVPVYLRPPVEFGPETQELAQVPHYETFA